MLPVKYSSSCECTVRWEMLPARNYHMQISVCCPGQLWHSFTQIVSECTDSDRDTSLSLVTSLHPPASDWLLISLILIKTPSHHQSTTSSFMRLEKVDWMAAPDCSILSLLQFTKLFANRHTVNHFIIAARGNSFRGGLFASISLVRCLKIRYRPYYTILDFSDAQNRAIHEWPRKKNRKSLLIPIQSIY